MTVARFGLRVFKESLSAVIGALIAFAAILSMVAWLDQQQRDGLKRSAVAEATSRAAQIGEAIEREMNSRLLLVRALVAFRNSRTSFTRAEFQDFANALQAGDPLIVSLQLAPKGVVTFRTGAEGSSGATGKDAYSGLPDPGAGAPPEPRFRITGPVKLGEGREAVLARYPVFQPKAGGGSEFWGFAAILIDHAGLLNEAGLGRVAGEYLVAVRGRDGLGAKGEVFFGDATVIDREPAIVTITLADGAWHLAIAPVGGWPVRWPNEIPFWIAALVIAAGLAATVFYVISSPAVMRRAIESATREAEQARADAESSSAAKSTFLRSLSHELRTPLNAVVGLAELLRSGRMGILDPRAVTALDRIHVSGVHLSGMIDDLLDMSAIEAGMIELDETTFDIRDVFETVHAMVWERAGRDRVSLSIDAPTSPQYMIADKRRMIQIVSNLVVNAIKFSHVDGEVSISCTERENGGCLIAVKDVGSGMTPAEVEWAMTVFGRVRRKGERQVDGIGVGLPLARELVEAHGGRLSIESEVGGGTEVRVELPPFRFLRFVSDAPEEEAEMMRTGTG